MNGFRIGDRVEFVSPGDNDFLVAQPGATGKVVDFRDGYVIIEWDRNNKLCGLQMDGGYYPECFRVIPPTEEELAEVRRSLGVTPENCPHTTLTYSEAPQAWQCSGCDEYFEVNPVGFEKSPEWLDFEKSVVLSMLPALENSAMVATLVPRGDGDVKWAVELGFSILRDKPILAIVPPDREIPERLRRVADEIVVGNLPEDREKIGEAIKAFAEKMT